MANEYPTDADVCNLALGKIGQTLISDIYGTGRTEQLCRLHLPTVRRELLESHTWGFATKRIHLPDSSLENVFGYKYRYGLPCEHLKVVAVYADVDAKVRIDKFTREGVALLCDYEEAYLIYVADIPSPLQWSAGFLSCVVLKLAAALSEPLGAGDGTRFLQQLEQITYPNAILNDAEEDGSGENNPTAERIAQSSYIQAHQAGF